MPETKRATADMSRFKIIENNRGSAYSEQLDKFLDRLNPSRIAAGYKPYTHSRLGRMLKQAGYRSNDLHQLYKECSQARNFGSLLNWKLKQRATK